MLLYIKKSLFRGTLWSGVVDDATTIGRPRRGYISLKQRELTKIVLYAILRISNLKIRKKERKMLAVKSKVPGLIGVYPNNEIAVPIVSIPERVTKYTYQIKDHTHWLQSEKQRNEIEDSIVQYSEKHLPLQGQFAIAITPSLCAVFSSEWVMENESMFPSHDIENVQDRNGFLRFLLLIALRKRIGGYLECLYPSTTMVFDIMKGTMKLNGLISLYILVHSEHINEYKGFEGQKRLAHDLGVEHIGQLYTVMSFFEQTSLLGWKQVHSSGKHAEEITIKLQTGDYRGMEGYLRLAKECKANLKTVYQIAASLSKYKDLGWKKVELPYKIAAYVYSKLSAPDFLQYKGIEGLFRIAEDVKNDSIGEIYAIANAINVSKDLEWSKTHLNKVTVQKVYSRLKSNLADYKGMEGIKKLQE